jgi:hypothetical protein
VLVRREAVVAHGLPDERLGRFAFIEWSRRALRDGRGWLLPSARAVLDPEPYGPERLRELPAAVRAVRRGGWGAGGRLRALSEVLRR